MREPSFIDGTNSVLYNLVPIQVVALPVEALKHDFSPSGDARQDAAFQNLLLFDRRGDVFNHWLRLWLRSENGRCSLTFLEKVEEFLRGIGGRLMFVFFDENLVFDNVKGA